jgi:hypothetical protein
MKRLIAVLGCALSPLMVGWTLHWDRVTTYTDGQAIDDDTVVYDIYQDGKQIGNGLSDNMLILGDVQRGNTYTFVGKSRLLRQGVVSDNSVPFVWTCQPGIPAAPNKFRVVQ